MEIIEVIQFNIMVKKVIRIIGLIEIEMMWGVVE